MISYIQMTSTVLNSKISYLETPIIFITRSIDEIYYNEAENQKH